MKNLFTLLLLVVSFLAVGQTNNTSEEIKYWKSIADSNDTVAYRQYLSRYGETGLYYDEAITRIALLKTSGKQAQSKGTECCFYSRYSGPKNVEFVVRFDDDHSKVWFRHIDYDTVRSNLAVSSDFYENQAAIAILRCRIKEINIFGKITDSNKNILSGATILATHTSGSKYHSKTDANGNFRLELPHSGTYQIEFRMDGFPSFVTSTQYKTQILNIILNKQSSSLCKVVAEAIQDIGNVWTTDEEYQYDPMKSTSSRDVYFKRDNLHQIDYYKYQYDKLGNGKPCDYPDYTVYVFSDDEYNDEYYNRKNDELWRQGWLTGYRNGIFEKTKTMQGYRHIAISKDKSSFIMWFEEEENLDGKIYEKREYKRIPKEELLPKAVNYDFLNK